MQKRFPFGLKGLRRRLRLTGNAFVAPVPSDFDVALPKVGSLWSEGEGQEVPAGSNHTGIYPGGIGAGDLVLVFIRTPGGGIPTVTGTGWTSVYASSQNRIYFFVAAGTESGTAYTYTHNTDQAQIRHIYVIKSGSFLAGSVPEAGAGGNFDPASFSPSWGARSPTLWLVIVGSQAVTGFEGVTGWPELLPYHRSGSRSVGSTTVAETYVAANWSQAQSFDCDAISWGAAPGQSVTVAIRGNRIDPVARHNTGLLPLRAWGPPDEYNYQAMRVFTPSGSVVVPDKPVAPFQFAVIQSWNQADSFNYQAGRLVVQPGAVVAPPTQPAPPFNWRAIQSWQDDQTAPVQRRPAVVQPGVPPAEPEPQFNWQVLQAWHGDLPGPVQRRPTVVQPGVVVAPAGQPALRFNWDALQSWHLDPGTVSQPRRPLVQDGSASQPPRRNAQSADFSRHWQTDPPAPQPRPSIVPPPVVVAGPKVPFRFEFQTIRAWWIDQDPWQQPRPRVTESGAVIPPGPGGPTPAQQPFYGFGGGGDMQFTPTTLPPIKIPPPRFSRESKPVNYQRPTKRGDTRTIRVTSGPLKGKTLEVNGVQDDDDESFIALLIALLAEET